MIKETDKRVNIKFLAKVKKTSNETFNLLRETYGKDGRVSTSTLTKRRHGIFRSLKARLERRETSDEHCFDGGNT